MILRPQLLLLDEPTAFLDPGQIRNLRQLLTAIAATGTTLVIANHDLNFVYDWADWVVVMHQGQVEMEGTPNQVFHHQQTLEHLGLGLPVVLQSNP